MKSKLSFGYGQLRMVSENTARIMLFSRENTIVMNNTGDSKGDEGRVVGERGGVGE